MDKARFQPGLATLSWKGDAGTGHPQPLSVTEEEPGQRREVTHPASWLNVGKAELEADQLAPLAKSLYFPHHTSQSQNMALTPTPKGMLHSRVCGLPLS